MKKQLIEMLKDKGAEVTVGKGFVHADFKRMRNATLTAQALRHYFPTVRFERAFDVLKLYI